VVTVVKRNVRGIPYYYLEHTIRIGGKFAQKSRYLGREIPKDIARIKSQFTYELNKEKWFDRFDAIKKNYLRDFSELPKSAKEKQVREFAVRFTYDTQRIEGSTLTLTETAQLLEQGVSPSGRPRTDVEEAEAHNRVFLAMLEQKKELSSQLVLDWHRELFNETKPDIAGQIRRHGVRITGSRFVPPSPVELQPMLQDFFSWYGRSTRKLHSVELAALVHLGFVTIHPFTDGNGRISRLMMNYVLNKNRYPMLNIEYKNRNSYYRALERSQVRRTDGVFANWFFRRYLREFTRVRVPKA
jgi:Fic family protein